VFIDGLSSVNNKRIGTVFEYQFFARALTHRLEVFTPLGDHLPQDCIIMNAAGTLYKTQIKGTQSFSGYKYKVDAQSGSAKKQPIDCHKVDILIAYIEPHNIFYVVPCLALNGVAAPCFFPHNEESKGRFEPYKEDWNQFMT
jgi:hypothetical protein